MRNKTEVRAWRPPFRDLVEIAFIRSGAGHGEIQVAAPLVFEPHGEAEYIEPSARLHLEDAQQLMDELWRCGLRPTEGTGSAGSLAATERHLKDMQAIAFGLLDRHGVKR